MMNKNVCESYSTYRVTLERWRAAPAEAAAAMNDSVTLVGILDEAVAGLDQCVQALSSSFELPQRVIVNGLEIFRHLNQDDLLLSFMQLLKIASHNNAAMVLIRAGFVNEVYALCRMIDEACEDIHFMQEPNGEDGRPTKQQVTFVDEFFQEEFSGQDLVESHNSRDRVSRQKIRAANARLGADQVKLDPSTEVKLTAALYGAFSGFVHGAYVHLMELFNGRYFHTRGMLGTPRIQECLANQVNHVFRSLLIVEGVGYRAFREDVVHRALDCSIALARQTKCLKAAGIESMVARRAQPLVKPT
jgi:hypothetical protein